MAVVGKRVRPTPFQAFRALGEGLRLKAAQREMLRRYPEVSARPPPGGPLTALLGTLLGLGFRLAPWPLRRRILHAALTRRPPRGPRA